MAEFSLYIIVDVLPIFITGSIVLIAYFVSLYCLLCLSLQKCLKHCFNKDLPPLSGYGCCQRFVFRIKRVFPAKTSGLFKKYVRLRILNFLKNRSRLLMDAECGPLDRELRENEDLLNSDHDSVSPDVYIPLGMYVVLTTLIAVILGIRSFLLRRERVCSEDADCFSLAGVLLNCSTYSAIEPLLCYFWQFDLGHGINTFAGLTITYYAALRLFSYLFQFCYRYIQVLRHSLLVICTTLGAIFVGFLNQLRSTYDGITIFSIVVGFFLPCIIPWENLYPPDYMDDNIYDEETLMEVSVDIASKLEVDAIMNANGGEHTLCNVQEIDPSSKKDNIGVKTGGLQNNGDNEVNCQMSTQNGNLIQ